MTKLYIIGNGFDLWHGLPTSYSNFHKFAEKTFEKIEIYYSFCISKENPWSDFENALGYFDWSEFYSDHNDIDISAENFRPSFIYSLEDDLSENSQHHINMIKNSFQEWISSIDISTIKKKLELPKNAIYITFNYTSTLEHVYEINEENVLHVHGRADKHDDLIFGHGESMDELPEIDENGDSNRTMFSDAESAAKQPFYALQKPVNQVLDSYKEFFESIVNIREIIIIGHSLNKIDRPYIKRIFAQVPNAKWTICLYKSKEKNTYIQALIDCSIPRELIQTCKYKDLEIKNEV